MMRCDRESFQDKVGVEMLVSIVDRTNVKNGGHANQCFYLLYRKNQLWLKQQAMYPIVQTPQWHWSEMSSRAAALPLLQCSVLCGNSRFSWRLAYGSLNLYTYVCMWVGTKAKDTCKWDTLRLSLNWSWLLIFSGRLWLPFSGCPVRGCVASQHLICMTRRSLEPRVIILCKLYMGVSYNGGTPKWMVYNGESY